MNVRHLRNLIYVAWSSSALVAFLFLIQALASATEGNFGLFLIQFLIFVFWSFQTKKYFKYRKVVNNDGTLNSDVDLD